MDLADFVMCARKVSTDGTHFENDPSPTSYLLVPDGELPLPSQAISATEWANRLIAQATRGHTSTGARIGDILVFIHGFNNGQDIVMQRHRRLRDDLAALGFDGVVASFDWPSKDDALAYLVDRHEAVVTALQLVTDGVELLCRYQDPSCRINVHLLAHSMGAFLVREAFDDADNNNGNIGMSNWMTSQVVLIAGDISMGSMSGNNPGAEAVYRHCVRLTNYSNSHDEVLALSNVKRVGVAPRVGRHGLPDDAPAGAVNVDCSDYYSTIPDAQPVIGSRSHSWHIGDPVFTRDLLSMLQGLDRGSVPTRASVSPNRFSLKRPA